MGERCIADARTGESHRTVRTTYGAQTLTYRTYTPTLAYRTHTLPSPSGGGFYFGGSLVLGSMFRNEKKCGCIPRAKPERFRPARKANALIRALAKTGVLIRPFTKSARLSATLDRSCEMETPLFLS
ncbi:hypothetical protein ACFQWB_11560 [Paenibacillus thermoaerophilus]|uniref:Uncharacterized protein n=1 Tax=Paenibacillus thermoaerophilus TaxID=1215385 RepID=A0ABW2V712_9BACL|nr:hypothetical protein [Paenibacillus thermoaerophilus]TMV11093.1 hypothetical protein FE781_13070 [Paenibacillus thermoaerophilus]